MTKTVITFDNLKYYDQCIKKYIKMQVGLNTTGSTHCPNCGAVITSSKCEYCGTDFEASTIWGIKEGENTYETK